MDHATTAQAITGLFGLGIGTVLGAVLRRGRIGQLHKSVAAKGLAIEARDERIAEQNKELAQLGNLCSELRIANGGLAAECAGTKAEIARLTPDAERGRKQREQSRRALEAAQQRNRERHAAKVAGNVEPITTAPRKRA